MRTKRNEDISKPATRLRAPGKRVATENGKGVGGLVADQSSALQQSIPFWRNLDIISQYQRAVFENWTASWTDHFQRCLQLAPTNLWQSILPMNFSCIQFTQTIRGNPALESKILTQVAGYGSQLGTIMDFLQVVAKRTGMTISRLRDNEEDVYKLVRFEDLIRRINRAKGEPQVTEGGGGSD
jgi:hypothetical protein